MATLPRSPASRSTDPTTTATIASAATSPGGENRNTPPIKSSMGPTTTQKPTMDSSLRSEGVIGGESPGCGRTVLAAGVGSLWFASFTTYILPAIGPIVTTLEYEDLRNVVIGDG